MARRSRTDRCVTPSLPWPPDRPPGERHGQMRIGILRTGTLAAALGEGWARAGHEVVIGGRSHVKAEKLAERLEHKVLAVAPREAVTGRDAVLLAVLTTASVSGPAPPTAAPSPRWPMPPSSGPNPTCDLASPHRCPQDTDTDRLQSVAAEGVPSA
ncbi:NAD(P)-binding domain-containing protein [Streptomyces sp. NEAU-NA10]|uniref:NAD(P)-binding domain-containing protein n=1 Tax=Streptomyces sp. NEAU-NA10 TaxID=3416050 RepID=UPI003CC51015